MQAKTKTKFKIKKDIEGANGTDNKLNSKHRNQNKYINNKKKC